MSEQPEALRLADILTAISEDPMWACHGEIDKITAEKAAAELRRLHSVNAELLERLKEVAAEARHPDYDWSVALLKTVRAAIEKAEEVKP